MSIILDYQPLTTEHVRANQNVLIQTIANEESYLKVTCMQTKSTPGIILKDLFQIKPLQKFELIIEGRVIEYIKPGRSSQITELSKKQTRAFVWICNVKTRVPIVGHSADIKNRVYLPMSDFQVIHMSFQYQGPANCPAKGLIKTNQYIKLYLGILFENPTRQSFMEIKSVKVLNHMPISIIPCKKNLKQLSPEKHIEQPKSEEHIEQSKSEEPLIEKSSIPLLNTNKTINYDGTQWNIIYVSSFSLEAQ